MFGIESWCETCELVTHHYSDVCGRCAAHRAAQVTVPLSRVARERAQSRIAPVSAAPRSRAIVIALECVAIASAIAAFAL